MRATASDSKGNIQMRCEHPRRRAYALVNSPLSKSIEKYDAEMGEISGSVGPKTYSSCIPFAVQEIGKS